MPVAHLPPLIAFGDDFDRIAFLAIDPFDRIAAARPGAKIDRVGAQAGEAGKRIGLFGCFGGGTENQENE